MGPKYSAFLLLRPSDQQMSNASGLLEIPCRMQTRCPMASSPSVSARTYCRRRAILLRTSLDLDSPPANSKYPPSILEASRPQTLPICRPTTTEGHRAPECRLRTETLETLQYFP